MDDIRRPQPPAGQDNAGPYYGPFQPGANPPPTAPEPTPPPMPRQPLQDTAQPVYPDYANSAPAQQYRPQPPAAPSQPPLKTKKRAKALTISAGALLAAAAIFGAGWMLKGSGPSNTIPANIARQANFNLYFPAPMPAGYTYMKDTATFQIGQVYYKFADGNKRVTVNEQPMPPQKPDLSLMSGYSIYDSPVGKVAVGESLGEATAVVLAPATVITFHSVGSVSQAELKTAISNLKNIGQNPKNT
jgi:hypothetical protein